MDLLQVFTCLDFPSYKDQHHDFENGYPSADLVNDAVVDAQEASDMENLENSSSEPPHNKAELGKLMLY